MKTKTAVLAWRRREANRPDPVCLRQVFGGPWDGETIVVRDNLQATLDLRVGAFRGRYVVLRELVERRTRRGTLWHEYADVLRWIEAAP